jgi:hypothetical protein
MGHLPGHRQVTLYVDPVLYERVRLTAHSLGEDIYEFVDAALTKGVVSRMSDERQRAAIEMVAKQNVKNEAARKKR